jgi:hypothetical protein
MDFLQHEPHGSGRGIHGQLSQRRVGVHPGTKLKLQLVEQPDEFRRRQNEARELSILVLGTYP